MADPAPLSFKTRGGGGGGWGGSHTRTGPGRPPGNARDNLALGNRAVFAGKLQDNFLSEWRSGGARPQGSGPLPLPKGEGYAVDPGNSPQHYVFVDSEVTSPCGWLEEDFAA